MDFCALAMVFTEKYNFSEFSIPEDHRFMSRNLTSGFPSLLYADDNKKLILEALS